MNPLNSSISSTPTTESPSYSQVAYNYTAVAYSASSTENFIYYGKQFTALPFRAKSAIQERISPELPQALIRTNRKVFSLVSSAFVELSSLAYLAGLYLTAYRKSSPLHPKDPSQEKEPILLVHGYIHNNSGWGYMKNKLHEAGYGPIYTINLTSFRSSIPEFAKQVQKKVKEIEKECGAESIKLIGHSMGGLVSAYYTENLAKEGKVSHVVTIASPLKGTHTAPLGVGKCIKQLRRHSPFTQSLMKKITRNNSTKYFHIASKVDVIVMPYTSALTGKNTERELLIEDRGHASLMAFCPQVPENIIRWLGETDDYEEAI